MSEPSLYDTIGVNYANRRSPDPSIFAALRPALGDAQRILNVGAGTGSYEPAEITVAAVDPSAVMVAQRPPHLIPAVLAAAENLPFLEDAFDGALAVLTIHHWRDLDAGLSELRRVTDGPIVILTFDPDIAGRWWLPVDYPVLLRPITEALPSLDSLREVLGSLDVRVVPVPARCRDGFLGSFWDRPELVLESSARAATSGFAQLDRETEQQVSEHLAAELETGRWDARHGELRMLPEFDAGLRLVTAHA